MRAKAGADCFGLSFWGVIFRCDFLGDLGTLSYASNSVYSDSHLSAVASMLK
jgi:hypothetical protein